MIYLKASSPASLWLLCLFTGVSCLCSFSFTCPLSVSPAPPRFAWAPAASPAIVVLRLCFAEPLSLLSPMSAIITKQTDASFLSCSSRFAAVWNHQRAESSRKRRSKRSALRKNVAQRARWHPDAPWHNFLNHKATGHTVLNQCLHDVPIEIKHKYVIKYTCTPAMISVYIKNFVFRWWCNDRHRGLFTNNKYIYSFRYPKHTRRWIWKVWKCQHKFRL